MIMSRALFLANGGSCTLEHCTITFATINA